jgi:hypothetical protein
MNRRSWRVSRRAFDWASRLVSDIDFCSSCLKVRFIGPLQIAQVARNFIAHILLTEPWMPFSAI